MITIKQRFKNVLESSLHEDANIKLPKEHIENIVNELVNVVNSEIEDLLDHAKDEISELLNTEI